MLKSLYNAVSGLYGQQTAMDVIGNNIANVNTTGFKASRVIFQDLMSQTLTGSKAASDTSGSINPKQVGSGSYVSSIDKVFTSGTLTSTSITTDLAIQGDGFFVIRGEGANEYYYTRAGDFSFDSNNTLVTSGGYVVQGWMADPETGEIIQSSGVTDIVLGSTYQVMQPKASTEINLTGALDTTATASTVTYGTLLTQASASDDVNSVLSSSGVAMDLSTGETVRITASPSIYTTMSQLCDSNGTSLGISELNGNVSFRINGTTYSLNYKSSGGGSTESDGYYTTIEDFIQEVNNIFQMATESIYGANYNDTGVPIATISFEDGKFVIEANYGYDGFEINSISGSSQLASMLSSLATTYSQGKTATSSELTYIEEISYGTDFTTLDQLANSISNAINGNIVSSGFSAEYLTNDFGLDEGEGINFSGITITTAGDDTYTISTNTFTYTDTANPTIANQFHTLQELGRLIIDDINSQLENLTDATGQNLNINARLTFTVDGDQLVFSLSGADVSLTFGESNLTQAVASSATPNTYLKSIFDSSLSGYTLNDVNSSVTVDSIDGKGRIVYSFQETDTNILLDLSTDEFNMNDNDTLVFYISGEADPIVLVYDSNSANNGQDGTFSTTDGLTLALETAINTILTNNNVTGNVTVDFDGENFTIEATDNASIAFTRIETSATIPYLKELLSDNMVGRTVTADSEISFSGQSNIVDSITGFDISKAYSGTIFNDNLFEDNMTGTIALGSTYTSKHFLTTASEDTLMMDLFDENGTDMEFVENQTTLTIQGSINGDTITNNGYFTIGATTTVADYLTALEEYLGLDSNSYDNVTIDNGVITITGEKGVRNNIDYLTITASGGSETSNTVFNNAMLGSLTSATGGIAYTTMTIYDEQGNAHNIYFTFSLWNEELNEWRMEISTDDGSSVAINGASQNELIIRFNSDGTLSHMYDRFTTPTKIISSPTLRFSTTNGTSTIQSIALNLGTSGTNDGLSIAANGGGITQASTDGYTIGDLTQVLFNTDGELVGTYSNGQTRVLGQIALATFVNEDGLEAVGDTMYAATVASGQATIGTPNSGNRGEIAASYLESSNVDLSTELVNLIVTQRAYQSNSKVITTSDELIQELLDMKR